MSLEIIRYSIKNEKLMPWVKFIWQFDALEADIHYKLLPTDCIDVIVNLANDMIYEVNKQKILAPRFHINGLRCRHSYIHQKNIVSVFGISFHPFGLYPFINKSIKKCQSAIIDLFDYAPNMAERINSAVEKTKNGTAPDITDSIEEALLSTLAPSDGFIEKAQLILKFISEDNLITVQSFCDNHSINLKTFERMVLSSTGFTPKTLRNIKRFQTVRNQLSHGSETSLAGIAADNRFVDQAHFTKAFKQFSGTTPQKFISEKISVKENATYIYR